ncbi:hypothetical protein [Pseudohaliea rubra]|uniref:Uncharacterized protein n=1 Tax=Pseudohaliea rubra DSM 19751 TaxID=1265313 RepID=A0A095XYA4_9GAMM|nr:hypothetical protein [Pseudohaliea rubra]KGE04736.1 hypothetical protein HRUBRA_00614 [Pseudohaliea rubra DSM 19751]
MKSNFKPLGIAAAVAVASAGYANVASAQTVANNALGDLALVPYYTVNGDWLTGVHIVNTSAQTQVVKFRFRRATDSMDALDFNIVMSPEDVYAGYLSDDDGAISWQADDTTCTVPATTGGKLTMPEIYRDDAETGYVEIIAMGAPEFETSPIAEAAKHKAGVPADCAAVRSNFFADGSSTSGSETRGVIDFETTYGVDADATDTVDFGGESTYTDSGNVLKVSYFIRDNATGVEFGDNAVHIQDFLENPSITNQQYGVFSGDLNGFDFPDLDGGVPTASPAERGKFVALRSGSVLGVSKLINEWTANTANGAALDWVVTMPGQYTMLDLPNYIEEELDADGAAVLDEDCKRGELNKACDYRDIPVTATIVPYNREELTSTPEEGGLTVSPAPPGEVQRLVLPNETNVITFGNKDQNGVLGVIGDVDITADLEQPYGWLSLEVASATTGDTAVCDWDVNTRVTNGEYSAAAGADLTMTCSSVGGNVPMIGFAAWARQVAANPDASYGRIVAHSFESAAP